MRKFLVKNFVLDYSFILFNRRWSAPRASRIIFPVMSLTGYLVATNPNYPIPNLFLGIMYFLCALSLFFGFVYFKIKPAQWKELDETQKIQYGYFLKNMLTDKEYIEWVILIEKSNNKIK